MIRHRYLTTRVAAAAGAVLLLGGCGDAGVPEAPENPIEGDPLPNQGREGLEDPDAGSTLGQEVPNPQPEQCDHTLDADDLSPDLLEVVEQAGTFEVFLDLLRDSDLADEMTTAGPFTVFAPTDEAFAALPPDVLEIFRTNPGDREELLRNHVISGACSAEDLREVPSASSLTDRDIEFAAADGELLVNEADVVQPDLEAANGVVHGIGSILLLPPVSAD